MIIEIPNENSIVKWKNDDKDEWKYAEISDLIKAIDNAPTVEVTDYDTGYQDGLEDGFNGIRPQGEWIRTALYGQTFYECNKCNCSFPYNWYNYCPNCGADMRGKEE